MKALSIFNGKVTCRSCAEFLTACGSHRKDKCYIDYLGGPEQAAMKLLNTSSENECITRLMSNLADMRSANRIAKTLKSNVDTKRYISIALKEYFENHPDTYTNLDIEVLVALRSMM